MLFGLLDSFIWQCVVVMNFCWYENSRSDAFGKIFRYVKFLENNHIFVIVRTKFFADYYFYRCRFRTG